MIALAASALSAEPPGLLVAAAANLNGVCQELGREFARTAGGAAVTCGFGATGALARQIENGGPFDLFLAADTAHVDGLERRGLTAAGSKAVYARGRLVLWVPPDSKLNIRSMNDLESVRYFALAQPSVAPYGAAAVESLEKLGLWERLRSKAVYAESIAMAKQFASSGNAEAAFTAYSLTIGGPGRTILVNEALHKPIDQALCVVGSSGKQGLARRFAEFVLGPAGKAILERRGYGI